MNKRPILIMAGGTGGHVFPALAVAEQLRANGWPVEWLGTQAGLEARVVPPTGIPVHWIKVRGLRGKGKLRLLMAPFMLVWALFQAAGVILKVEVSGGRARHSGMRVTNRTSYPVHRIEDHLYVLHSLLFTGFNRLLMLLGLLGLAALKVYSLIIRQERLYGDFELEENRHSGRPTSRRRHV